MPTHARKKSCCCPQVGKVARYLECEPVISFPSGSIVLNNVSFFLDLGEDTELNPDLVLYDGGPASTAQIPVLFSYDFMIFVPPASGITIHWDDNDITGNNNLDKIYALRHRGWKIKDQGLQLTTAQMFFGDGVSGTRFIFELPGTESDDLIQQVDGGGYFFLGGEFGQTPALIQEKTSLDQDGNDVTFFVGYNPRKECSKPEQGRYYGDDHSNLLFDFTVLFPNSVTFNFTYKFGDDPSQTETFEKTYTKFVSGAGTRQETEILDNGPSQYKNVSGFIENEEQCDVNQSFYIQFGYRAINNTEKREDPDGGADFIIAVPSMPIRYFSIGSRDFYGGGSPLADPAISIGDGASSLSPLQTQQDFFTTNAKEFFPHQYRVGDVMSDITVGPGLAQLEPDSEVETTGGGGPAIFAVPTSSNPSPNPTFGNQPHSALSYKGQTALRNNITFSLEAAYIALSTVPRHLGSSINAPLNSTIRNLRAFESFGTIDVPAIKLDSQTGQIGLVSNSNPFTGAYHFLTNGLSSGSFFQFPCIPTSVTQS